MIGRRVISIAPMLLLITYGFSAFASTVQARTLQASSAAPIVTTGGAYTALAPKRLLDTRTSRTPLGANGTLNLTVTGGSVPANATAVALNVTVTDTTAAGYLSVNPAGASRPVVSNLNWVQGETVPNLVIVPVGSNGQVTIYNYTGKTNVVVDLEGYFAPEAAGSTAGSYVPLAPARITDTRAGSGYPNAGKTLAAGGTLNVQVAGVGGVPSSGVTGAILNVTVTNTTAAGYLTAYPEGTSRLVTSNLNWTAGETVANRVVVPLSSSGMITLYNHTGSTDVVVDVSGYFTNGASTPANASLYDPITPVRVLDTRLTGTTLSGGSTLAVPMAGVDGIASNATAVATNVTAVNTTAASFFTVYPGGTRPTSSDVNWMAGQIVPNLTLATLSSAGSISIYNHAGSADVIVDAFGYFYRMSLPPSNPGSLTVSIADLPAAVLGAVVVTGPNGYRALVSSTTTLSNLPPGQYTVAASDTPNAGGAYWPVVPYTTLVVPAGGSAHTSVDYADYVPNTTIIINPSQVISLTGTPGAQIITLAPGTQALAAGDVLNTGIGPETPNGLLTKVVSVSTVGGEQVAALTSATLPEAMPMAVFDINATLSAPQAFLPLTAATSNDWHMTSRSESIAASSYSGSTNPFDYSGDSPFSCTTSAGITVGPTLSVTPSVHFSGKIGLVGLFPAVVRATATGTITATAALTASAQAGASCTLSKVNLGPTFTLPDIQTLIGPFYFDVSPQVSLTIAGSGSVSDSLSTGMSVTISATAGLDYTYNNGFSPVARHSVTYNYQAPQVSANASLQITVGPQLNLLLYHLAGPEITIDTVLQFHANTTTTPWWQLQGCLEAGAGFTVPILNLDYSDPSILKACKTLLQASSPPPLAVSTTSLPGGVGGQPYSATILATHGNPPYSWAVTAGSLPTGLSLNATTGTVSGTPTSAGISTFTVTATDSSTPKMTANQALIIQIAAPSPLSITSVSPLPTAIVGTPYTTTLQASGGYPPYTWTITSGALPAGLILNPTTGVVSGTPIIASTYTLTVMVVDSKDATSGMPIAITTTTSNIVLNWSSPTAVDSPVETGIIASNSCPSVTFCVAVDDAGNALMWNGLTWSIPKSISGGYEDLSSVSCASRTFCVALSNGGHATVWNGTDWSIPQVVYSTALSGASPSVSCPSSTFCMSVDDTGLATWWNGTTWSTPKSIEPQINNTTSVSCASASFCAAVDGGGNAIMWNGTQWSAPKYIDNNPTNNYLSAVSCPSSTFCVAVDNAGYAITWNGSTWSTPQKVGPYALSSISCPSTALCISTTDFGSVFAWNGASWSSVQSIDASTYFLNSISCPSVSLCVVVGDNESQSNAIVWNGAHWSTPEPILQNAYRPGGLSSISCPVATFCAAVNNFGDASIWTGGTWSLPQQIDNLNALVSISCTATNFCITVDNVGDALTWNGTSWSSSRQIFNQGGTVADFTAVSCTSSSFCVAVDTAGNVFYWNGTTWSTPQVIDTANNASLVSISCVLDKFCMAIDSQGNALTWNGGVWSSLQGIDSATTSSGFALSSVSCTSMSVCVAVDTNGNVLTWNGSSWSSPQSIDPNGGGLNSVSCTSASFCVAVDLFGNALVWNGTTWSSPQSIDPNVGLADVSCASSHFCVAVDYLGNAIIGRS